MSRGEWKHVSDTVLITGVAGELGSHLARLCLDLGFKVVGIDVVRFREAWRFKLLNLHGEKNFTYIWKNVFDLDFTTLRKYAPWLIIQCDAQPDRPAGELSPTWTFQQNVMSPLHLAKLVLENPVKPTLMIYPSSGVVWLGVPPSQQPVNEYTPPKPQGWYALSKYFAEEIYRNLRRTYGLNTLSIRTGSCYGPMGRSDQFLHRVIIEALREKEKIVVKSPLAARTYTFIEDALSLWRIVIEKTWNEPDWVSVCSELREVDWTLLNAGNAENRPYTNVEVAKIIVEELVKSRSVVEVTHEYEPTELVYDPKEGRKVPVKVWEDWTRSVSYRLLGWQPRYTLRDGLRKTIKWFEENLDMYL